MKKILTLLFVMATALMSFSGCQSQGESYGNYNENSKDMYGDDWQLSIFSYDEYVKFTYHALLLLKDIRYLNYAFKVTKISCCVSISTLSNFLCVHLK